MIKTMNKYKKRRLEKGLSQLMLAKMTGISRETIRRWESGETKPYPHKLKQLEKVLGDLSE